MRRNIGKELKSTEIHFLNLHKCIFQKIDKSNKKPHNGGNAKEALNKTKKSQHEKRQQGEEV